MFVKSDVLLQYSLVPSENGVEFKVLEQAPEVYAFLQNHNFMASNGIRVAMAKYPEFKHSKNIIFLRGSDAGNNNKPDYTRFVGSMQRNNAIAMFDAALSEFISVVKKWRESAYILFNYAFQAPVEYVSGNQFIVAPFRYKIPKVNFFKPVNVQKVYIY
jgi:hypothetical protein